MDPVDNFLKALAALPELWIEARFARCVTRDVLEGIQPPEFLYTSGKANRYNPAGIQCVYFSENLEVVIREYSRYANALAPAPFTSYFADANLPYLDLNDADTLVLLGLLPTYLHASWRLSTSATPQQRDHIRPLRTINAGSLSEVTWNRVGLREIASSDIQASSVTATIL